MAGRVSLGLSLLILLVIAGYFIILGIQGINAYNSNFNKADHWLNELFEPRENPITLILAIAEITAGVALALSLILSGLGNTLQWGVIIAWIAKIVYTSFFVRISTSGDSIVFSPDFIGWLAFLLVDLIILLALLSAKSGRT